MSYWWHACKFGGEVILLTEDEAKAGMKAKTTGSSFTVSRLKMMIDTKEIAEFEQSSRTMPSDAKQLGSGLPSDTRTSASRPKTSPTGGIECQWVKRLVSERSYAREYAGRPGYWALRRDDELGALYVVHSRPVMVDMVMGAERIAPLPDGLKILEEPWEPAIIEKRLASEPGWWNG
jgi:hypothetical protein